MVRSWHASSWVFVLLSSTAAICACLNDYDQFEAAGSIVDPQTGGGAPGAAGSSGTAGTSGAGAGTDAAGGEGGLGGAGPGGNAGSSGEGGAAGAPLVCEAPTVVCGDVCADNESDEEHCGACGNSCTEQSPGFACASAQCQCTSFEQCGSDNAERDCEAGRCVCNGETCSPGEICGRRGNQYTCECNGDDSCGAGRSCCESPRGCFDLLWDSESCGACGRSCPMGESCILGQCG